MIKGNRVALRAVEREDLQLFRDWRNLQEFRRNFRETRELNMADQEAWFESLQKTRQTNFMFTIVDAPSMKPIGACGLLYTNWFIRSADFSFYVGHQNAYVDGEQAHEAAKLLIDYGFKSLNLNRIWMELYEFDQKKIDFFKKKFGFKEDGKLRQNAFEDGKYWDSYLISLLSSEHR